MNLLVTGAFGFVGLNAVRVLAAKPGVRILATGRRDPDAAAVRFLEPVADRVRPVKLDVTDRTALHDLVRDAGVTHIIHGAAATPSVEQERENTTGVVDVNLGGAVNALNAAVTAPSVERFLFLSSSGVYGLTGQSEQGELAEESPLALDNLYAITKRSAELLTARYAVLHDKPMASVRLGPIYGLMERPSASRDRLSAPAQLLSALQAGRAITVAGAAVTRDWTYAGDVGEALWALLTAAVWRHPVYNMSYGRSVTLRRLVDACVGHGLNATWSDSPDRADVAMQPQQTRTPMANQRLFEDTGYRPATNPEEGIAQSIGTVE